MRFSLIKAWPLLLLIIFNLIFFKSFLFEGKLPIPSDTIVGMYHPWRDFYSQDYPNGIPFKNFLITDPVRQQYVWRQLSIDLLKQGQWPLWNPYNFSGTPLLANFQSAVFYPLNVLFFILPFNFAWTIQVMSQPLLAGIFLHLYLYNHKLSSWGSLLGGLSFAYGGFSIAWLEWNTVLQVGLWLPLILLSIDKIFYYFPFGENEKLKNKNEKLQCKNKNLIIWSLVFIFSLCSSFFGGHLQLFFYVFIFSTIYLFIIWWQNNKRGKIIFLFFIFYVLFFILTAIQWLPTLEFLKLSSREFDLPNWQTSSWFLPWQHLVQFFAPDFFGNPATLNYWGEWNYGEFIGYIGILPLVFALLAIFYRRDRKTWFFSGGVLFSLIMVLPTPLAKLPFEFSIPLLSTGQPTRLLFLTDFSLAILAALGFDLFTRSFNDLKHFKKFIKVSLMVGIVFLIFWLFVLVDQTWFKVVTSENLAITKRNLILPTFFFVASFSLSILYHILIYNIRAKRIILIFLFSLVIFDLFRFGWKFTPFTKKEWIFPKTDTIKFLENQPKPFRFMTADRRIFPPNFATYYRLEDVSGYDPLYLKTYGELIAAWNRGKPDTNPLSFNRILTPQDYWSKLTDLLNVKYILSLNEETLPKLRLVFQEGQTRVYENKNVLPRAFFVEQVQWVNDEKEAIDRLFNKDIDFRKIAVVRRTAAKRETISPTFFKVGKIKILSSSENRIIIQTENKEEGFLVLTDSFYPTWHIKMSQRNLPSNFEREIYRTDYHFRGLLVPAGKQEIELYVTPFNLL